MVSRYVWKGGIERDNESLLVIKTERARVGDVIDALGDLHPYDVPELLSLPVERGAEPYLRWVSESAGPPDAP